MIVRSDPREVGPPASYTASEMLSSKRPADCLTVTHVILVTSIFTEFSAV